MCHFGSELGHVFIVLQWDLGFYSDDLLPTSRGYDSFYGSYLSYGDYVTHRAKDSVSFLCHQNHHKQCKQTVCTKMGPREKL